MIKIFCTLLLGMFASQAYGDASLRFKDSPNLVDHDEVYLGDIAELNNLGPIDMQTLEQVKIAESIEELKKMSPHDIMKKIRPQIRILERRCECKLHITLPHVLAIRSIHVPFSMEAVQNRMQGELKKECVACEIETSQLHVISGAVPEKFKRWDIAIRKAEWRGPSMVRVFFDNDTFSPLILQTLIKIKQPILQLKDTVAMGSPVTPDHCESVMTDVTYETKKYAKASDLVNTEAKRTLPKAWPLALDDLTAKNMVRVGQPVAVEVQNNSFMIEMSGVAQKTGKLGEKIPVRLNKTKKQISAEIVSDARVRM